MSAAKNAQKISALRRNPWVALTIDTEVHPLKSLLIRGRAELDVVDGIPDGGRRIPGHAQSDRCTLVRTTARR
jgi:hypothetical protein